MQALTRYDQRLHEKKSNDAKALQDKNMHQRALIPLRENLDLTTRILGIDHLRTINDQESLSDCLSEVGSHAEAAALDRKTLQAKRKVSKKAPDTLATQFSLAYNLGELHQYAEAIDLYRKTLISREEVLGSSHNDTLETRQSLASCLYRIGQYKEARDLNEHVLKAREKHAPSDDPDLIACRHNLATNHHAMGSFDAAWALTCQNLTILRTSAIRDQAQLESVLELRTVVQKDIETAKVARERAERARTEALKKAAEDEKHRELEKAKVAREKTMREWIESAAEAQKRREAEEAKVAREKKERERVEALKSAAEAQKRREAEEAKVSRKWREEERTKALMIAAEAERLRKAEAEEAERLHSLESANAVKEASRQRRRQTGEVKRQEQLQVEEEFREVTTQDNQRLQGTVEQVEGAQEAGKPRKNKQEKGQEWTLPFPHQRFSSGRQDRDQAKIRNAALSPPSGDRKPRTRSNENVVSSTSHALDPEMIRDWIPRPCSANAIPMSNYSNLCDAFEGDDNSANIMANQSWFREFHSRTGSLLAQGRMAKGRRVKIAILDTGIDLTHPEFDEVDSYYPGHGVPRRERVEWRSFVNSEGNSDDDGHGTHSAALLLRLAPKAKIFVAQVVEGRDGRVDPEIVAKAIEHATFQWKVDIITMSLGWQSWHKPVEEAIKSASSRNIILFAAASNGGANLPVAFPANCPPVICVHSANGWGARSHFTPDPFVGGVNFAVIGEAVNSCWPRSRGEGLEKRRWGTSTSAPMLAAIASLVLEFVDQKPSPTPHDLRLRSPRGMTQVLLAMSTHRSGYEVVMPWQVLDDKVGRVMSEARISDSLAKLFG